MTHTLSRRVAAEFLGTLFLVAAVIGFGIMGDRLAGGNVALALANTVATAAALVALSMRGTKAKPFPHQLRKPNRRG